MSNTGMSSCCLSGHLHSGTPKGREDTLGGLDTYISEPESGSKNKSLIFIVDIFGWKLKNVRLLADEYAKAGFYVYIPDVHEGDSLPESFLQSVEPPLKEREQQGLISKASGTVDVMATLGPWLAKHREAVALPLIEGFVNTVRQIPGTDKLGAVGFCWGGRYAILQAHNYSQKDGKVGGVDAAYACHPSLVSVPADFDPVDKPLSIAVGDKDSLLDVKSIEQIRELLSEKSGVDTEVKVYEDQIHGFALRGDWSSDKDKKSMDEALQQGVNWFNKHLK